jgi:voltage-gated sodium channel
MFDYLKTLLAHPLAERLVIGLIVVNAITLGLETSPAIMAKWGPLLHIIDTAILVFFVVELALRLAVHRLAFFKEGWNVFDFIVVAISLAPASDSLSVLRALRILRALRLITAVPSLKRVVSALISALPGMGSIVLLLGLIFYVGAVLSTKLFGSCPAGVEDKACLSENFETLGASLITLFQVMTLDAWADGLLKPLMKYQPYAWLFFIPFVLVTAFVALNLFIGVVVSALESESEAARAAAEKGQALPTMPVTDLDVLAEIRALRSEIAALRATMPAKSSGPT